MDVDMIRVAEVHGRRCGLYTLRLTFSMGCGEGMACVLGLSIPRQVKGWSSTHTRGVSDRTAFGKFPLRFDNAQPYSHTVQ